MPDSGFVSVKTDASEIEEAASEIIASTRVLQKALYFSLCCITIVVALNVTRSASATDQDITLYVSDVEQTGPPSSATVYYRQPIFQRTRLYVLHSQKNGVNHRRFVVRIYNGGAQTADLWLTFGIAGPNAGDAAMIEAKAAGCFIFARWQSPLIALRIQIPSGNYHDIGGGTLSSDPAKQPDPSYPSFVGIYQIDPVGSLPSNLQIIVMGGPAQQVSFAGDGSSYPGSPPPDEKTPRSHQTTISDRGTVSASYVMGNGPSSLASVQIDSDAGNYGSSHTVTFHLVNNSSHTRIVNFFIKPSAGKFQATVVRASDGLMYQTNMLCGSKADPNECNISLAPGKVRYILPSQFSEAVSPNSSPDVTLVTLSEGGSNYPLRFEAGEGLQDSQPTSQRNPPKSGFNFNFSGPISGLNGQKMCNYSLPG